jgi:hypothetical protein
VQSTHACSKWTVRCRLSNPRELLPVAGASVRHSAPKYLLRTTANRSPRFEPNISRNANLITCFRSPRRLSHRRYGVQSLWRCVQHHSSLRAAPTFHKVKACADLASLSSSLWSAPSLPSIPGCRHGPGNGAAAGSRYATVTPLSHSIARLTTRVQVLLQACPLPLEWHRPPVFRRL